MKKKSGNKNLDNDLDFGDLDDLEADGGMDFGDLEDVDMSSRKPSTSEIAKEMAKEAGQGFLDSTARKAAEKALPDSYKDNYYAAVEYADFAKETFQASKGKINKSLYNLGKEVKKILPFQSKMLDGFLQKYESDFEAFKSQTEEQIREGSIQSNLSSIFDKQLEITKAIESKRSAEDQADRKQNLAISKVNLDVLTSIDNNLSNQTAFTLQISKEYYRKSLELQYKSYFVQADMLKDMRDYYKGFSIQFEEIKKNTALPDFVKLQTSERVSELMRTQFIQNTYKQLFSNSEYMQNVKKRMTNIINEKISSITDNVDNVTDALSGINQAGEMSGGGGRVLGGIMSGMGGGILGEKAGNWLGDKLGTKTKDNKYVKAGGNYLNMMANSPRTFFSMLRGKTQSAKENYQDEGTPLRFLASKLLGGADELLSATDPNMQRFDVKKKNILDHNKPAIFDNKVHRSITEVIPMYLAKILSENTNLRLMYKTVNLGKLKNFSDKEEQVYNYVDRKLSTKAEFRAAVDQSVFKDTGKESKKITSAADNINSLALSSVDKKTDKEAYKILSNKGNQKSFQEFMSMASTKIDAKDFNYDNVVTNIDKDPGLKAIVEKNPKLKQYVETLQSLNLSKKNSNLNERVKDSRRIYPTLGVIELFREASRLVGSKTLNNVKGDAANLISKALVAYMHGRNKPITLSSICDATCFAFIPEKDKSVCFPYLEVFIPQCRQIQAEDDTYKNSQITLFISMVNESLFNSFEFNPDTFQTLHDYDSDLQDSGQLGITNLVEGKLGKDNKDEALVDAGELKALSKRGSRAVKKALEARSKLDIIDITEKSAFGKHLSKFTDIGSKFSKDINEAEGFDGMKSAVKSMLKSVSEQSQESAKEAYKNVTKSLNGLQKQIDDLIKKDGPGVKENAKKKMLEMADNYIRKIDSLIAAEEATLREEEAKLSELAASVRENVSENSLDSVMREGTKTMVQAKKKEIALLKKFKGTLHESRNGIANIDTNVQTMTEFSQQAIQPFRTFIAKAKATLKEFEDEVKAAEAATI